MKTRASGVRNDARGAFVASQERIIPKGHIADVRSGAMPSSGTGYVRKKQQPEPKTKIVVKNGVLTIVSD